MRPIDVADSIERGKTLPSAWYVDRDVFSLEREMIFRHSWQYAGLRETLTGPGDFFTCRVGAVPIVVLLDEDGHLRAFVNVCRHRGSELVLQPCGTRKAFQCHYHAWTYGLDGSLLAAPGERAEEGFDRSEFSLPSVQVACWGPFIFVNPDADAPPLGEILGVLPSLVDETGVPLGAIRRRARQEYEIAANWKVVVDNYLECYHCPVAHPAFSDLIDVNDYHVTEYDYFSTQGGPVRESARREREGLYDTGGGVDEGFYAYLWPNFTINIYPGPGNVSLNLFVPLAPDRTLAVYDYCLVDEISPDEETAFVAFLDAVQREDIALCESVQRGLESGSLAQGRLMLSRESALRHFQRLVYRTLVKPGSGEAGPHSRPCSPG